MKLYSSMTYYPSSCFVHHVNDVPIRYRNLWSPSLLDVKQISHLIFLTPFDEFLFASSQGKKRWAYHSKKFLNHKQGFPVRAPILSWGWFSSTDRLQRPSSSIFPVRVGETAVAGSRGSGSAKSLNKALISPGFSDVDYEDPRGHGSPAKKYISHGNNAHRGKRYMSTFFLLFDRKISLNALQFSGKSMIDFWLQSFRLMTNLKALRFGLWKCNESHGFHRLFFDSLWAEFWLKKVSEAIDVRHYCKISKPFDAFQI